MSIIGRLLAGAIALALSASLAQAAEYTMRISHQFPPSHHTAKRLAQFAKDVAKETDGKVQVQLFGAAQLFKPKQHHAAVASGQLEAAIILSIQWGGSLPEMAVTQIPFLMSSPAKQKAFIGSEAAKLLDQKMLDKGVRNIGWIVDTNDLIFTSSTQLLDDPSKFKDVKIRGLNKLFDAGLIAMGAVPVSMSGSEVYQALQTRVVDAALTGVQAASSRKYYEVQKYGAATPIFLVFDNLVVNPAWWDGLPEDVRAGITRAADKAVQSSLITHEGVNPDDMKKLTDAGMDAVVLTSEQAQAFEAVMQPAVREAFLKSSGDDGQKLIDLIKAM
ncbi:C4-dicarboxylate ABC transporter [Allopusillimonas soli]|uniref:TRAP transporter substrate-binding protein DctP n=1 Tax=Allopusillimonas soli TaxID=659016 RepID=A0A853FBN3_9BURK|nr:TRAP transporter substrate-binding protein DctP [Allopusillimonas soli]NYT37178.1 TRAP transporter substrate-binding protein DctP [Allopusillimonas soli]TEA74820.1 C4-dicarboxylate ABC transporter [Allopusillimonas soli]